jgi:hypothetical protein
VRSVEERQAAAERLQRWLFRGLAAAVSVLVIGGFVSGGHGITVGGAVLLAVVLALVVGLMYGMLALLRRVVQARGGSLSPVVLDLDKDRKRAAALAFRRGELPTDPGVREGTARLARQVVAITPIVIVAPLVGLLMLASGRPSGLFPPVVDVAIAMAGVVGLVGWLVAWRRARRYLALDATQES